MFWYEDVLLNEELGLTPPTWLVSGGEPVIVEKVDDTTVVFRFSTLNGLFLQMLATPEGHLPTIWPKHYLEQFHPKYNEAGLDALVQEAGVANWVELWEQRIGMNLFEVARWQNTELPMLTAWRLASPYDGNATRSRQYDSASSSWSSKLSLLPRPAFIFRASASCMTPSILLKTQGLTPVRRLNSAGVRPFTVSYIIPKFAAL